MSRKTPTIFLASSPYGSENAYTALRLAEAALAKGHQVLRALIGAGGRCEYLGEDVAMRGFTAADLVAGCAPVDYAGLVDTLLADGSSVAGTF